jgi:acetate kinase
VPGAAGQAPAVQPRASGGHARGPRLDLDRALIVLALNCGSSSIKFAAYESAGHRRIARGLVERLGEKAHLKFEADGAAGLEETAAVGDHAEGLGRIIAWLAGAGRRVDAVGHRVVHGGARFSASARVDDDVIAAIQAMEELAPLHNAPSLAGIRNVGMVAVFDTAFHADLPEHARTYALPHELAARHGIRRYGFHGTSYRSVIARHAELSGRADARVVAFHLGNGASAAAVAGGKSVETSMGFTPLEGLVMGTRAGDVDPAIAAFLARRESVGVDQVIEWLNRRSGLRGLSGIGNDVRDLLAREATDPRARLALAVFCHRARKYLGAYLATLGGADAVIFTGGIGEHAPAIRERICAGMAWCGLELDPGRNARATGTEARISADRSRIEAFAIPTDEERIIALDTIAVLALGS